MAAFFTYRNYTHLMRAPGLLFRTARQLGVRVINKTGSSIAKNVPVCISGYDTTAKALKVVLADADAALIHQDVFITRAAIANNGVGYVYKGFMSSADINTSGATAAGDPVFLSTTAGGLTFTTGPTGAAVVQLVIGYVQVKSATVGQIFFDVQTYPNKTGTVDANA